MRHPHRKTKRAQSTMKGSAADRGSADLAEARRVDAKICVLVKRRRRNDADLALLLLDVQTRGLHQLLGFSDLASYAMSRGIVDAPRKVRDLLSLLHKTEPLPHHRAALLAGEVDWTKVRTSALIATPDTDAHWLERAKTLNSRQLEAAVAEARGRAPQTKWGLTLTPERAALRERTFAAIRHALDREVTDSDILEVLCRSWLERSAALPEATLAQTAIVIHTDDQGGRPTMESAAGEVEISHASLERAVCGGAVLDLRDPSVRFRSTIPPKIARFVQARDKGTCRVNGCDRPGTPHVELAAGKRLFINDPSQVLLLCAVHHLGRHEGTLRIMRNARTTHLCLRDGTPAPAHPSATSRTQRSESKPGKEKRGKTKPGDENRGTTNRGKTGTRIAEPRAVTSIRARAPA